MRPEREIVPPMPTQGDRDEADRRADEAVEREKGRVPPATLEAQLNEHLASRGWRRCPYCDFRGCGSCDFTGVLEIDEAAP